MRKQTSEDGENLSEAREPWRDFIARIIKQKQIRQALEEVTTIRNLTRWTNGETNPQPHMFQQIANQLPQHLKDEFIRLVHQTRPTIEFAERNELGTFIPSEYILRMLFGAAEMASPIRVYTMTQIAAMQLQELLYELVSKRYTLLLAQCHPSSDGSIRDLKLQVLASGDVVFSASYPFLREPFLEALALRVIQSCQPLLMNDRDQTLLAGQGLPIEGVVAAPILRQGKVAGCLLVLSTDKNAFSDIQCDLIKKYTYLFALPFNDTDFYPPDRIITSDVSFALHPDHVHACLESFTERVRYYLIMEPSLSLQQAEERAIREMKQVWGSDTQQKGE